MEQQPESSKVAGVVNEGNLAPKSYHRPQLTRYGDLRETQSGHGRGLFENSPQATSYAGPDKIGF
ncbi:MAG: hypothetical protein EXR62_11330 [Chloroflexi bacterium]|nr:hypothetical protein [Chloroflexota bacterium]